MQSNGPAHPSVGIDAEGSGSNSGPNGSAPHINTDHNGVQTFIDDTRPRGGSAKIRRISLDRAMPVAGKMSLDAAGREIAPHTGPSGVDRPDKDVEGAQAKAQGSGSAGRGKLFDYPLPTPEQLDAELPPLQQHGDVPMGLLLERVVGKGYKDMRVLVEHTLPPLAPRDRPLPIIKYAKSTRQTVLKYLAILRWKNAVDTVQYASPSSSSSAPSLVNGSANGAYPVKAEYELATPIDERIGMNGLTTTPIQPGARGGIDGTEPEAGLQMTKDGRRVVKGRLMDIRRIEWFVKYQNEQHDRAVNHLQHVCGMMETLRIRNPDLLTALSLLTSGTYTRLPLSLTAPFDPKPPLTNGQIARSLSRLNELIRYRLRCEDYVPPEMVLEGVRDGRAFFVGGAERRGVRGASSKRRKIDALPGGVGGNGDGGGRVNADADNESPRAVGTEKNRPEDRSSRQIQPPQWRAQVTWVNFDDHAQAPRWWLTGVEWWWRERPIASRPSGGGSGSGCGTGAKSADTDDVEGDAPGAPNEEKNAATQAQADSKSKSRRRLRGVERQRVLDYANQFILAPQLLRKGASPAPVGADTGAGAPAAAASGTGAGDTNVDNTGEGSRAVARRAVEDAGMAGTPGVGGKDLSMPGSSSAELEGRRGEEKKAEAREEREVDAPLVRLHNFIQHLSLTYQLELLFSQALQLAHGRWRGNLSVDMDREKRQLVLRYWTRPRPPPAPSARRPPSAPLPAPNKTPLVGGIITLSVSEDAEAGGAGAGESESAWSLIDGITSDGAVPTDTVLRQRLAVKWEVGDGGEGGGWRSGMNLDHLGGMELDPQALSIDTILLSATRRHAAHMTRAVCAPLLGLPRLNVFADRPPQLVQEGNQRATDTPGGAESTSGTVVLRIPLTSTSRASRSRTSRAVAPGPIARSPMTSRIAEEADGPCLLVKVSSLTGLVDITDTGALATLGAGASGAMGHAAGLKVPGGGAGDTVDRAKRTALACKSVNDGRTRLGDDTGRLVAAVITENIESQLRQLGYAFSRKLAMRSQDMQAHELHPATSIFVPLPTIAPAPSTLPFGPIATQPAISLPSHTTHYLLVRMLSHGLAFELIRMARVQLDGGVGSRLIIADKVPVDLEVMRQRRRGGQGEGQGMGEGKGRSRFEVDSEDLRDLYVYCNAMVAQSILEQQLKDRSIPYTLQLPPAQGPGAPHSRAAVAGMIPALVMNVADLLKDPRAAEVARNKVYMQLKGWWRGDKCSADTIVRLLHPPTAASASATAKPNGLYASKDAAGDVVMAGDDGSSNMDAKTPKTPITPGPVATTKTSRAAREEGITFDQASSVVTFHADDLTRCVPLFLEQWERLSKVILIAGEVSKLARSPSFRDLRMLSFDLRSAIFTYAPQHYCSITYDPAVDAYISSFSRTATFAPSFTRAQTVNAHTPNYTGNGTNGVASAQTPNGHTLPTPASSGMQGLTPMTPVVPGADGVNGTHYPQGLTPAATTPGTFNAASPGDAGPANPHEMMAGLLSWRLNELVKQRRDVAARFIKILCATLPLLSTIEDLQSQAEAALQAASGETPRIAESPSVRVQSAQHKGVGPVQLVVRSIEQYKLIWDVDNEKRYAIDAKLLPSRHDAVVLSDASAANSDGDLEDESCGTLATIHGWKDGLVKRVWQSLRDDTVPSSKHETAHNADTVDYTENAASAKAGLSATVPAPRSRPSPFANKGKSAALPPMCMDGGASLLVPIDMLESAVRRIVKEVERALATPEKDGEKGVTDKGAGANGEAVMGGSGK